MTLDPFNALRALALPSGEQARYVSLPALEQAGLGRISRLPVTLRIMLESLARNCDGRRVTREHVEALASWQPNGRRTAEVPFVVGRVVAHEVAGIPALGDLAAMRNAAQRLGRDPAAIEPRVPVTMVIDHTLQVDYHTGPDALARNVKLEMQRNEERFRFVKWAQQAFRSFDVVPPGHGILHQVNLEYLARGLLRQGDLLYPDTLVGTDSHTVMIAGIGVVGWGVGGMEASAAMLGEPICILSPDVVGVHLTGRLPAGVTATDLVLSITERLRTENVVSKFVEYCGEGVRSLTVPDRATLSNMTPEYGATIGYFPPDTILCDYFAATGRTPAEIDAFRAYFTAQGMFGIPELGSIDYTRVIDFDLAQVRPSVAGPKRPQDRCDLGRVREQFGDWLRKPVAQGGYGKTPQAAGIGPHAIRHGHVLLAAISSCTNTANPGVMLAAGLLARNAVARGLRTRPWVKTSLTPGSRAVAIYLEKTGLQQPLNALGFRLVGFGCATCNGGSGPLDPLIEAVVGQGDVIGCAVLSGNRNFEARIHATCKATYLMSPPLVVACALAGTLDIDFEHDPLGTGSDGAQVYLRDIWPEPEELQRLLPRAYDPADYREAYARFDRNPEWNAVPAPDGPLFPWDETSTYIKEPPFFLDFSLTPPPVSDILGARALAILGDSITTDHISPVNLIPLQTPAGSYLRDMGVKPADFNLYGARRMNHEVLVRTTFANLRLRNLMVPGIEGGYTRHQPDGAPMPIFDAAMRYCDEGVPQFVFAGADYGMGSARDSAAKGTALLGVKAVFAKSFERIHRTNLVCVGILPCQFVDGRGLEFLSLAGDESFDLKVIDDNIAPQQQAVLRVRRANGEAIEVPVLMRLDTLAEVECFRQGGLLPGYLRTLVNAP